MIGNRPLRNWTEFYAVSILRASSFPQIGKSWCFTSNPKYMRLSILHIPCKSKIKTTAKTRADFNHPNRSKTMISRFQIVESDE